MELDLAGMHQLAIEQGIDLEQLGAALEEALRLAYLKTPHAAKHARVELDTGMLGRLRCFQIGQTQRLFQCGALLFEIDSLLYGELMHSCQVQFHTQYLL